jgi:hypothetical protein
MRPVSQALRYGEGSATGSKRSMSALLIAGARPELLGSSEQIDGGNPHVHRLAFPGQGPARTRVEAKRSAKMDPSPEDICCSTA